MTDIFPHVIEAVRMIRANPDSLESVAAQIIAAAQYRGMERAAVIAESIDSGRGNEKEIAAAIRNAKEQTNG